MLLGRGTRPPSLGAGTCFKERIGLGTLVGRSSLHDITNHVRFRLVSTERTACLSNHEPLSCAASNSLCSAG